MRPTPFVALMLVSLLAPLTSRAQSEDRVQKWLRNSDGRWNSQADRLVGEGLRLRVGCDHAECSEQHQRAFFHPDSNSVAVHTLRHARHARSLSRGPSPSHACMGNVAEWRCRELSLSAPNAPPQHAR